MRSIRAEQMLSNCSQNARLCKYGILLNNGGKEAGCLCFEHDLELLFCHARRKRSVALDPSFNNLTPMGNIREVRGGVTAWKEYRTVMVKKKGWGARGLDDALQSTVIPFYDY